MREDLRQPVFTPLCQIHFRGLVFLTQLVAGSLDLPLGVPDSTVRGTKRALGHWALQGWYGRSTPTLIQHSLWQKYELLCRLQNTAGQRQAEVRTFGLARGQCPVSKLLIGLAFRSVDLTMAGPGDRVMKRWPSNQHAFSLELEPKCLLVQPRRWIAKVQKLPRMGQFGRIQFRKYWAKKVPMSFQRTPHGNKMVQLVMKKRLDVQRPIEVLWSKFDDNQAV
ncbi:hypothetical protein RRG08_044653 [Elysia crispata]|uniref:Uncharacterized protein n=1 Tax=Elysia crispata TaxID=231223 RepID=A0AAE1EAI0_9GAST|nr:hypothetical protein RRG08_044653 [Elysia crispata]